MGLDSLFKPKGKLMLQSQDNILPGAVVPIDVRVTAEEDMTPREICAELVGQETYYVTESYSDSKGHRRTRTVGRNEAFASIVQTVAEQPSLPSGTDQKWSCSLQLPPDAPPTCRGKLVNIRWTLKAVIDVPKRADLSQEKSLNVFFQSPQISEISILSIEKSFGEVTLLLIAPPVATTGRALKGQLTLQIKDKLSIRSIRAELVRVEEAGSRKVDEVVSTTQISGEHSFNQNESPSFEFSLVIPAAVPPTAACRRSSLGWKVRAVLDRKMKTDFNVEQELLVYNASKT